MKDQVEHDLRAVIFAARLAAVGTTVRAATARSARAGARATEQLLEVLQWVEWSWVGASLGGGMVGY